MSASPCNLDRYFAFENFPGNVNSISIDNALMMYGFFLSLGLTCADIRPDFDSSIEGWASGLYLKNGDRLNDPAGDLEISWPPDEILWTSIDFQSNLGFSINVKEVVYVGPGEPTMSVDRGTMQIGWIAESVSCQSGLPLIHFKHVFEGGFSGMPITVGNGNTVGFSVTFGVYNGPTPFTGTVTCENLETLFLDNVSGKNNWGPGGGTDVTYNPSGTTHRLSAVTDPEGLWCCVTAGYDCCSPSPGRNVYAPGFLIPPPTTPAPGEENVTQPPLKSLLLLSNHTFQFPANYGVQKK